MAGPITTESIVTSKLDASGYAQGAQTMVAANEAIAASGTRMEASQAKADRSTLRAAENFEKLAARLDATVKAAQDYERGMAIIAAGQERAAVGAERAAAMEARLTDARLKATIAEAGRITALDQLVAKYSPLDAAEQRHATALREIAVLATTGAASEDVLSAARLRAATVLATETAALDQAAAAEREAMAAKVQARQAYVPLATAQAAYVAQVNGIIAAQQREQITAEEGAAARLRAVQTYQQQSDAIERARIQTLSYVSANDSLRATLLPGEAAAQKYAVSMKLIADAHARGVLSATEFTRATTEAKRALDASQNSHVAAVAGIGAIGQKLQSAGFQAQDFIVQVAGGQNALLALGQQGSQFLGSFGVAGAIAGAGLALATLIPLLIIGKTETEKFDETVKRITDSYTAMAERAERYRTGMETEANQIRTMAALYNSLTDAQQRAERVKLSLQQADLTDRNKELLRSIAGSGSQTASVDEFGRVTSSSGNGLEAATAAVREFAAAGVLTREAFDGLLARLGDVGNAAGKPNAAFRELMATVLAFETKVISAEEAQKRITAQMELLSGGANGAASALSTMGASIQAQLSPLEELSRKLGDATIKLRAFQNGGSNILRGAERQIAIDTETEAERTRTATFLNSAAGGALSPQDADRAANEQVAAIRARITARLEANDELARLKALDDAAEKRRRDEAARASPIGRRQGVRASYDAADEADRLGFGTDDPRRQKLIDDRVATANARDTATAPKGPRNNTLVAEAQAAGYLAIAEAAEKSTAAVMRANAELEASKKLAEGATGTMQGLSQAILERNAAQEAAKQGERVAKLREEEAALRRVAVASALGPRAAAQETLNNQIEEATRLARANAEVTNDPAVRARLEKDIAATEAIMRNKAKINELDAANKDINNQGQQLALLQTESSLMGTNADYRERELAAVRATQDLQAKGRDLNTDQSRTIIQNARNIADATRELKLQQNSWDTLANAGTQAFEKVGDVLTKAFTEGRVQALKLKDVIAGLASDLIQTFAKMALLNPIKNYLFGGTAATLGGLFGGSSGSSGGFGNFFGTANASPTINADGSSSGMSFSTIGSIAGLAKDAYQAMGGTALNGVGTSIGNFLSSPAYSYGSGMSAANYGVAAVADGGYGAVSATPASTVSYAGVAGGVAGIAGGAYGIATGLERGGVGGYTTAAGGAVGVAAGASVLGAFGPALAALGPYGLVAAGVIMLIGSLLPGAKPTNATGTAAIDFPSGATDIYGQTGKKYSQENRDAANSLAQSAYAATNAVKQLIPAAEFAGRLTVDVGNRDGIAGRFITAQGYDSDTQHFSNDEQGQKDLMKFALTEALAQMAPKLNNVLENAIGGMAKDSFEQIMTDLAKLSEATNGGKPSDNQNIAASRLDFGNFDNAISELKWIKDVYDPLVATTQVAGSFEQAITGLSTQWQTLIDHANTLGLATDVLSSKYMQAIADATETRNRAVNSATTNLQNRQLVAEGGNTQAAELFAFDASAGDQRVNWQKQLADWGLTAAQQVGYIVQLENTLGAERLAIIKKYAAAAAQQQNSYYDSLWSAQGREYFTSARNIRTQYQTLASDPTFTAGGQNPADLYYAQAAALFKTLDVTQLADLAQGMSGWDDTFSALAQAAHDQRVAADAQQKAADDLQKAAGSLSPNVISLTDYARSLQTSDASPLSARSMYETSQSGFNAVSGAAAAGDAASLRKLQSYSEDFLTQSANVNGTSGMAYLADFQKVINALGAAGAASVEQLTASVLREETRTQTQALQDTLNDLIAEVVTLRRQVAQSSAAPDRLVA